MPDEEILPQLDFGPNDESANDTEGEDDLSALTAVAISQSVVFSTDWTTETILRQLDRGNIEMDPAYQRRDAWRAGTKSRFIESLMLGLPIPQLVFAESKGKRGSYIVIDGKQRLLTLRQFAAKHDDPDYSPLVLTGLKIRSDLNGKTLETLANDPACQADLDAFSNQTIRTVVLRNWPNEEFLFLVFLRLNSETVKLSPQELRQALHPGEFVKFTVQRSSASTALQSFFNRSEPDFRMRDVELFVRYYAFKNFISSYRGNLKEFLDSTCRELNARWSVEQGQLTAQADELDAAIEATVSVFGPRNAFKKSDGEGYEKSRNRAVFDIMVYYFSDVNIRRAVLQHRAEVEVAFRQLCTNTEFVRAIESTTKSVGSTYLRLALWGHALGSAVGMNIPVPVIAAT